MKDDIKLVYVGSEVEAMFVVEILKENGIGSMKRDRLQYSVDAGWAQGLPEDSLQVFVEAFNYDKAKMILDDYFSSRDKK